MSSRREAEPGTWTCRTCGGQYPPAPEPPGGCRVCLDYRQYVPPSGQAWVRREELVAAGQGYDLRELEPGLTGLRCEPQLGIGPVGYLVPSAAGNLLWDCPSHVDDAIAAEVGRRGGIAAISASHPHFYGAMADWSRVFDAPIRLPAADREWVLTPSSSIEAWEGSAELLPGLTAHQCGGHFPGSSVLHWPAGAGGRGALFTGDTIMVAADRRWVSFLRSYPNHLPLPAAEVRRILATVEPLAFDRIYGNPGWEKVIGSGAKAAVERSGARYLEAVGA